MQLPRSAQTACVAQIQGSVHKTVVVHAAAGAAKISEIRNQQLRTHSTKWCASKLLHSAGDVLYALLMGIHEKICGI